MAFGWFHKKKSQPLLVEGQQTVKGVRDIETLKAGKLASMALSLTKELIDKHGPRIAGSDSSKATASDIAEELKPFCNSIAVDDFHFHPQAMDRPWKYLGPVYIVTLLLLWVGLPFSSIVVITLFSLFTAREVLWYRPLLERLSPSEKGRNVTGVIEPEGEVTDTLLFSGHHDSARLFRYDRNDKVSYLNHVVLPFTCCGLLVVESLVQLFTEIFTGKLFAVGIPSVGLIIYLVLLSLGTPLVWNLRSIMGDEGSPGAGDNLVSSCMAVELARYFDWKKRCGEPLQHTRLIFASFDGEEAGLRGSREWFKTHKELLVNAKMLNFDCPYYADQLKFLDKDINGTQPLSTRLVSEMVKISSAMGYTTTVQSIPMFSGGTDAAEGERAGIEACTLTAVAWGDRKYPEVYHTVDDTVEAIEDETIERAISIAIRLAETVDGDKFAEGDKPIIETPEKEPETEDKPQLKFNRVL